MEAIVRNGQRISGKVAEILVRVGLAIPAEASEGVVKKPIHKIPVKRSLKPKVKK
jgi:hypothetical protein